MVPPPTFAPSGASSFAAASSTTAAAFIPAWAQQQPQPARGPTDQLARQTASEALFGKVERRKNELDARRADVRQRRNQDAGAAMTVAASPAQPLLAELTRSDLDLSWGQFTWKSQAQTAASQSQQEWDLWRIEKAAKSTRIERVAPVTPVVAILPPANATHGMNVIAIDFEAHRRCWPGPSHIEKSQAVFRTIRELGRHRILGQPLLVLPQTYRASPHQAALPGTYHRYELRHRRLCATRELLRRGVPKFGYTRG